MARGNELLTLKGKHTATWIVKNLFFKISDHTDLLKRISIRLIAGGLIFRGLRNYLPIITDTFALAFGCRPLKIRPQPALVGISFEISSFEDKHDLQLIS